MNTCSDRFALFPQTFSSGSIHNMVNLLLLFHRSLWCYYYFSVFFLFKSISIDCLLSFSSFLFIFTLSLSSYLFYFRYSLFQLYNSRLFIFNIFEVFAYHTVQVFKIYNSMICSKFTHLWNHHHFQVLNMTLTPKRSLLTMGAVPIPNPSPRKVLIHILSLLPFLVISY